MNSHKIALRLEELQNLATKTHKRQVIKTEMNQYLQFYYCDICNIVVLMDDSHSEVCGKCGILFEIRHVWILGIQNLINLHIQIQDKEGINLLLEENKPESA